MSISSLVCDLSQASKVTGLAREDELIW